MYVSQVGNKLFGVKSYTIVPSATSINEGVTSSVTVNTKNVLSGTTLYWTITNITTADADFTAVSGSFTISGTPAAGTGSFNITTVADSTTEGNQTFTVSIRTDSITGTVVKTSATLTVVDTSLNPTYAFTTTPASINEGSAGSFTVTTTDVPVGTTLYWTINHVSTVAADFAAESGSFTNAGTLASSTGSFNITPTADFITEGAQTFTVSIRTVSITGTVVTTSTSVTVNDTSVETYTFTVTPASINEGSPGTFTVTTQGVPNATSLFWTINHVTTVAADFVAESGSFSIGSNTGSFTITPTADATTEGAQTFTVSIRTVSITGTVRTTSSSVTVNDTSLTPTYAFTTTPASINEGATGSFVITTANVADGTTLFWTINNVTTGGLADFSAVSGSFAINTNTGSFSVGPLADNLTEGAETFTVSIRTVSITGTVVVTSASVTVNDTSVETYAFTTTPGSINEGSVGSFTVTTAGVPNSTTLFWTINHVSTVAADFSAESGSFTITSNSGTFGITASSDLLTEGPQTFTVSVRTTSITGTVRATSATVTVNDTSVAPTYAFTTTPGSINEGVAGSFTVTTTGVADFTTLFWTINNTTTDAADFSASSGSFTVTAGSGTFSITPVADLTTEGAQTFTVSVRTGSVAGTIVATSASVTVNDTSLTPVVTFTLTPASINEGASGTFNISVTNFPSGTLFWNTLHGTTAAADFSLNSGSFTVTGSAGTFNVTAIADSTTEGAQTFQVEVRTVSNAGTVRGTSASVTINDTSISPTGQIQHIGSDNFLNAGALLLNWTVPTGVTNVSAVCIGGGGGGANVVTGGNGGGSAAGGGGGLFYANNFVVTAGAVYALRAGHGGAQGTASGIANPGGSGGTSNITNPSGTVILAATGGGGGVRSTTSGAVNQGGLGGSPNINSTGGTGTGGSGGRGGGGLNGNNTISSSFDQGGGGGTGGYASGATGGRGGGWEAPSFAIVVALAGTNGAGGGGGGKASIANGVSGPSASNNYPARGGGTGVYGGTTPSGAAGASSPNTVAGNGVQGGNGSAVLNDFGAGGAAIPTPAGAAGGRRGAIRIVWPGATRQFPGTNVGTDL